MADFSIALNNIQNVKQVNIEGHGLLTARKLGSGEELDLSSKIRRTNKIISELSSMDFTKFDTTKPEGLKDLERLASRAEALGDELAAIKQFEFDTYKRCLTDDQGGKVVDVIMNTLTDQERSELFKQIFGEATQVDTPQEPQTAEEPKEGADV